MAHFDANQCLTSASKSDNQMHKIFHLSPKHVFDAKTVSWLECFFGTANVQYFAHFVFGHFPGFNQDPVFRILQDGRKISPFPYMQLNPIPQKTMLG